MATQLTKHTDLEEAVCNVVKSYDGSEEINNLESAALPNRRAVIEALSHLIPALYMGFYSRRPLNRQNLYYSVSEHLYPAYEILVDQIQRAITYEQRQGRVAETITADWSERVVLGLFNELPNIRQRLNGDVLAAYEGDPAAQSIEEVVFSYPGLRAITAHRVAHVLYQARVPMIPRIISEWAHSETGIDIHAGATVGDRFFIDHGNGVVIGETACIGNNVKLYQGVTLGALSISRVLRSEGTTAHKRHPTIEDNVTIYAGARILGGETTIGHDSVIGGNVWIVKSVAPFSKIFGRSPQAELAPSDAPSSS